MNISLKPISIFVTLCFLVIPYDHLRAMEESLEIKKEKILFQAAKDRDVDTIENLLSQNPFGFVPLMTAYTYTLKQAKKLTPKRSNDPYLQKVIAAVRSEREKALTKLKSGQTIDETLIHRGEAYLKCAQALYAQLESWLENPAYATIFFFQIVPIDEPTSVQNFVNTHAKYIDFDYCNSKGENSLHRAIANGNLPMVEYLVTTTIDCNKQTYYQENQSLPDKTPLHYAIKNYDIDMVKCLLKHCCKTDIADYFGDLPLHYVSPGYTTHQGIFEMLLDAGADIDGFDGQDKTMLYKAVESNELKAVRYLLALGANPNISKSGFIQTPLELADMYDFISSVNEPFTLKKSKKIFDLLKLYSQKRGAQDASQGSEEDSDSYEEDSNSLGSEPM